jgi:hypothetical protein
MMKCIDANTIDRDTPATTPLEQTQGMSQGPESDERYQYLGQVAASVSQSAGSLPLLEFENSG